jgi:hypothetical protein
MIVVRLFLVMPRPRARSVVLVAAENSVALDQNWPTQLPVADLLASQCISGIPVATIEDHQ